MTLASTAPAPNTQAPGSCWCARDPEQDDGVQVHVRVEERQGEARGQHGAERRGTVGRRVEVLRVPGAPGGADGEHEQERRTRVAGHREHHRVVGHERAEPGDARGDQQRVRRRADGHHGQHVLAADALPEHEGVLGTDRDDEGRAVRKPERATEGTIPTVGPTL